MIYPIFGMIIRKIGMIIADFRMIRQLIGKTIQGLYKIGTYWIKMNFQSVYF